MGWKVRINALLPAARQQMAQLAQLLAKLPGISAAQALQGLNKPPLDLPALKTEADAQKLMTGLSKMGLICEIIDQGSTPVVAESEPISKPETSLPEKIAPAPKLNAQAQQPDASAAKQPTKAASTAAPRPKSHDSIFDLDEPTRTPIELRAGGSQVKRKKIFKLPKLQRPSRRTLFIAGALLVTALIVGASFLVVQHFQQATTDESSQSAKPVTAERKAERDHYEEALQQMATSEKYLKEAHETPDVRKAAEIMELAVKYNPYNWGAWRELAAMYRRMGNEERAKTCDFSYRRSEKLQRTLEGIASVFRKPEAKITTSEVSYTVHEDSIQPKDFHQKSSTLYDTVHNMHPEKEFRIENQGKDTLKVQVLPGDSFPSFDSWEELERKGKKKH